MGNAIAWLNANWVNIAAIYGCVVALATIIVKLTPSQADDAVLAKVLAVVSFFSHAEDKKPADKPSVP